MSSAIALLRYIPRYSALRSMNISRRWFRFHLYPGRLIHPIGDLNRQDFFNKVGERRRSDYGHLYLYISVTAHRGIFLLCDDLLVNPDIFIGHSACRKIFLDIFTGGSPVNLINALDELHHLIDIMHQEACFAMHYNLRRRTPRERNDRTTQCHCFNHHHTKWLFPHNWIQKPSRPAEQAYLLPHIYLANIFEL